MLDTHTFLWWHSDRAKLSAKVMNLCEDPENQLLLSVVSLWEIQIKHHLGKLKLSKHLDEIVAVEQQENQIDLLLLKPAHIFELYNLPLHHRDPFDRLLVAQARFESASLLSNDSAIAQYPVQVEW